jgi:hypothetical protein
MGGRGRRRRCGAHEITVLLRDSAPKLTLCFLLRKREFGGDVAVFYNAVLIPKWKNMAKSMADFSDYPPYFSPCFAEVLIWRRHGAMS